MLEPAADSRLDTGAASRLVIRVTLSSEESPAVDPAPRRLSKNALVLILGAVAVLLSWLAISIFGSEPSPSSAVVADQPLPAPANPKPADESAVANLPETNPIVPESQQPPDAPISAIDEVIPDVPKSALDTIRGTIRVVMRVSVDRQGTVVDAAADEPGPSRYFKRLALEASKKWTFTPAKSAELRVMLLKFNFTRNGASASASPMP